MPSTPPMGLGREISRIAMSRIPPPRATNPGTTEFASQSEIFVLRRENGQQRRLPFNFQAVLRGRDLDQNVLLRSGDVVVVP